MKAASQNEIRKELQGKTQNELLQYCLRLSRFKKENKELLTYLLFESDNEEAYVLSVKQQTEEAFTQINTSSYYFIKKSVRKIQRDVRKYIRYSDSKETEVDLLIHFCQCLVKMEPSYKGNVALVNLLRRQKDAIVRCIKGLHEDLQYDYRKELQKITV